MNNNKIKIGVLGTANIALKSVIPNIQKLDSEFDLVGVATRNIKDKPAYPFPLVHGYEALLEKNLDALYIPLPNALHYEWIKKALNKGMHVLVEKSLACSYAEVVELNDAAKRNNLVLIENFQFQKHNQFDYINELIKQKKILGDIRIMRSTFCCPPFKDKNNIRYQKQLGGGALLDAGAYPIKISQFILGNELEVNSASLVFDKNKKVDIQGAGGLRQQNGNLTAQIAFGFDHYYQCNIELIGSKGKLYTNRIFTAHPNVAPIIFLETNAKGSEKIQLKADNHFKNMLLYFRKLILTPENRTKEYEQNINQARLISQFKKQSDA